MIISYFTCSPCTCKSLIVASLPHLSFWSYLKQFSNNSLALILHLNPLQLYCFFLPFLFLFYSINVSNCLHCRYKSQLTCASLHHFSFVDFTCSTSYHLQHYIHPLQPTRISINPCISLYILTQSSCFLSVTFPIALVRGQYLCVSILHFWYYLQEFDPSVNVSGYLSIFY